MPRQRIHFISLYLILLLIYTSTAQIQTIRTLVNSSELGPSAFDDNTDRIYFFDIAEDDGYHLYWISYLDGYSLDSALACNLTDLFGERLIGVSELFNNLGESQVSYGRNGEIFFPVTVEGTGKVNSVIEFKSFGSTCKDVYSGDFRNLNDGVWIHSDTQNDVVYLSLTVDKAGEPAFAIVTYDVTGGIVNLVHEMMFSDFTKFSGFPALEGLNHAYFLNEDFLGSHEIWAVNRTSASKIGQLTTTKSIVRFVADSARNILCFQGSSDLSFFTFTSATEYTEEVISATFIASPGSHPVRFLESGSFMYFNSVPNLVQRNTNVTTFPVLRTISGSTGTPLFIAEESGLFVGKYQTSNFITFSISSGASSTINLPSGYTGNLLGVNDKKGQVLATLMSGGTRNLFIFPVEQSNNYSVVNASINYISNPEYLHIDDSISIIVFREGDVISAITYQDCIGEGFYGDNCLLECSCSETGTVNCMDGSAGNGTCNCKTGYIGKNCSQCDGGYFGKVDEQELFCIECPDCVHGTCSDGTTGNGTCICTGNWNGTLCDSCLEPYIGENCEDLPTSTSEQTSESVSVSTSVSETTTGKTTSDSVQESSTNTDPILTTTNAANVPLIFTLCSITLLILL